MDTTHKILGIFASLVVILSFFGITRLSGCSVLNRNVRTQPILPRMHIASNSPPVSRNAYEVKSTSLVKMLYFNGSRVERELVEFAYSPNRERIAYTCRPSGNGWLDLVIVSADGSKKAQYDFDSPHSSIYGSGSSKADLTNLVWTDELNLRFYIGPSSGKPPTATVRIGNFHDMKPGTYEAQIDEFNSIMKLKKLY